MTNYVIEGTISEITKKGEKNTFKFSGTEGYALKKKDKDKCIKMNVFSPCLEGKDNKYVEDNKTPSHSLKISEEFDFNISDNYIALCFSAVASGRKVRFIFEENAESNESTINDETKVLDKVILRIISVSLLSD